jgi:DNA-binding CsgD family transcriptional regulator
MGSIRLDAQDTRLILDIAGGADGLAERRDVPHLLSALAQVVPCDVLFWDWYRHTPTLQELALTDAEGTLPVWRAPLDGWLANLADHPIMSGRHGRVVAVSDVLRTRRELESTWLWQEALRPAGVRYEIGVELSHPSDEMSVVVLSRGDGRDFDDRDHLVLRLLRPHLDAAVRRVARPATALTDRERQVMLLVRDGLTDAQVARRLGVAEATVSKHLEHVYAKSGARSRVQAVAVCAPALEAPADDGVSAVRPPAAAGSAGRSRR